MDLCDVDPATVLFGRQLSAPILLTPLLDETSAPEHVVRNLAQVAQALSLALDVRVGQNSITHLTDGPVSEVRRLAPDALLFCDLDLSQLRQGVTTADAQRLADRAGADALVLHIDPLRDALRGATERSLRGALGQIGALCRGLRTPVVVKEDGWGLPPDVVTRLLDVGVAAVDVTGAGATERTEEGWLGASPAQLAELDGAFADWGLSTAEAVIGARRAAPHARVFVGGGIRDAVDTAKAIALGADLVAAPAAVSRAARIGADEAIRVARQLILTLRLAMLWVGADCIPALQATTRLVSQSHGAARMHREQLSYRTPGGGRFVDITDDVAAVVRRSHVQQGMVHVYSQHTTAAVRVNENEPLLLSDFVHALDRLIPVGGYEHDDFERRVNTPPGEPKNGHAHVRHLFLGTSETVPVVDGAMALGTWQRIFLIELCSPRPRGVTVQVIEGG